MSTVHLIDHPLVQHKLTLMRRKEASTNSFRRMLGELSTLMAYEITRDFPLQDLEIETPMEKMVGKVIDGKKLALVSILRAGNGFLDGMLNVVPGARIGHIGLYRDPETLQERGMTLVPPYNHADVIAGQGTSAMELFQDVPQLDYLFVCLGGGGLLSGCLLSAKAMAPQCKVYGVEPEAGNDAQQSLRKSEIVKIATPRTIADGAQTQALGDLTYAIIRRDVTDIVTASDPQLVDCMRFYAERMKMVVEPTGALSLAGARFGGVDLQGARVGVLISGGNVDLGRYAQLLGSA